MDRYQPHPGGYGQAPPLRQDYGRGRNPSDSWPSGPDNGQFTGHHRPAATVVRLDDYNSDLNFEMERDGLCGGSHTGPGFDYMWAGARATHGVGSGKVCFEVAILDKLPVTLPETETTPHVVRVGWSVDASNLHVGEDTLSYGYGGTAKCSVNNKFFDYGERYSSNDVITCYIDLDATPKCVFFAKNGLYLGVAFRLGPEAHKVAFFPHVTVKNMRVKVNFGGQAPYFPPVQGFRMIQDADPVSLVPGTVGPASQRECQVIMMVGLPGAGKTYWAENYVKQHPDKKFYILGTNAIMDNMKVMNLMRRRNYHGRWDALIKQATDILNKVLKIAEKRNRNYILDQTNVYPNARRRKMNNFRGFYRIAATLVNTNEVLKQRTEKREREEGKIVPESAIMEMKANFTLPEVGEIFDDVWFQEEDKESSQRLVKQFRVEGQEFKDAEKKRKPDDKQGPQEGTENKRPRVDHAPPTQNAPQIKDYNHGSRNETREPQRYQMPSKPQGPPAGSYGGYNPRGASGGGSEHDKYGPPDRHGPPKGDLGHDRYRQPDGPSAPVHDRYPTERYLPPRGGPGPDRYGTSGHADYKNGPPRQAPVPDRYGLSSSAPDTYGPSGPAPDRYGTSGYADDRNGPPRQAPVPDTYGSSSSALDTYGPSCQAPDIYGDSGASRAYGSNGQGGYHGAGWQGGANTEGRGQSAMASQGTYQQGYGMPPQNYGAYNPQGHGSQGYGYSSQQYRL